MCPPLAASPLLPIAVALFACLVPVRGAELLRESFDSEALAGWTKRDGAWRVADGGVTAGKGFSALLREKEQIRDGVIEAHAAYEHDAPFAAAGLLFRMGEDFTGYAVCLREVEKGVDPQHGPWERPVLQLVRLDRTGWKVLRESKVMECRSGLLRHVRVAFRGPDLFVYYEDMETPVFREFDDRYDRPGGVGLFKDQAGAGKFDNFAISTIGETPAPPLRRTSPGRSFAQETSRERFTGPGRSLRFIFSA